MIEHRNEEYESLRFDSSWGFRIFSLFHARDKTKNIFLYFFTELKTYEFGILQADHMLILWLIIVVAMSILFRVESPPYRNGAICVSQWPTHVLFTDMYIFM